MKKFLERKITGNLPGVLVATGKHSTRYMNALTMETLLASALTLLKDTMSSGYLFKPDPNDYEASKPSMSLVEAQNLPDGQIKKMVLAEHSTVSRFAANFKLHMDQYERAKATLDANDGETALEILFERQDYEYEKIELVALE